MSRVAVRWAVPNRAEMKPRAGKEEEDEGKRRGGGKEEEEEWMRKGGGTGARIHMKRRKRGGGAEEGGWLSARNMHMGRRIAWRQERRARMQSAAGCRAVLGLRTRESEHGWLERRRMQTALTTERSLVLEIA